MAEPLLFIPFSPWCVKSADGHYSVTKAGPNFARTYQAWYTPQPENRWNQGILLGVARSGSESEMKREAKAFCQNHADQRQEHAA